MAKGKITQIIGPVVDFAFNAEEMPKIFETVEVMKDKEKLVVVKFISYANGEKEEGIFKNHKQFGNSWSEMACDFYVNGKLIQKETYYDCKANADIDPKIFDYKNYYVMQFTAILNHRS